MKFTENEMSVISLEMTIDLREMQILGSMLIDPGMLPSVSEHLSSDLFTSLLNKEIYLAIEALSKAGQIIDCMTVYLHIRSKGSVHADGMQLKKHFDALMNSVAFADKTQVIRLAEDIRNELKCHSRT